MAVTKWPSDTWISLIETLGPWPGDKYPGSADFFNGIIPIMDARQFIYNFAKSMIEYIPHQPPEYLQDVTGWIDAYFSTEVKASVTLGTVGYDANTHMVSITVNSPIAGPQKQTMHIPVQCVIPLVFQLLIMIPWDFVNEVEGIHQDVLGNDSTPSAPDTLRFVYNAIRKGCKDKWDVSLPSLPDVPNNYDTAHKGGKVLPRNAMPLLYNIPIINLTQALYTAAGELIDVMGHHPPVYDKDVYTGGVYTIIEYTLIKSDGTKEVSDMLPEYFLLTGNRLVITAYFRHEIGEVTDDPSHILLDYTFGNETGYVDFEAQTAGHDIFFAIDGTPLGEVTLDLETADTAMNNFAPLLQAEKDELPILNDKVEAAKKAAIDAGNDYTVDQDYIDAVNAYTEQSLVVTYFQNRFNILVTRRFQAYTGQNTPTEELKNFMIKLPDGIGMDAKNVTLVALEHGFDAVTVNGNEVLPATNTRFRLQINVKPVGDKAVGNVTIPASYTGFIPYNVLNYTAKESVYGLQGVPAIAEKNGLTTVSIKNNNATVTIDSATATQYPWMQIAVRSIGHFGRDNEEGIDDPGGYTGSRATLQVDISNSDTAVQTLSEQTMTDANGTIVPVKFSIGTEVFYVDFDMPLFRKYLPASIIPASLKTYNSTKVSQTEFTDKPLTEVEVAFSSAVWDGVTSSGADVPDGRVFLSWKGAEEIEYIGEEFNLGSLPGGAVPDTGNHYLQARLRYRVEERTNPRTGASEPSKNWYVQYTDTPEKTPHGVCKTLNIAYDAVARLVKVTNLMNNETVQMKTNAVIWYLIQLIMLIPVEVM